MSGTSRRPRPHTPVDRVPLSARTDTARAVGVVMSVVPCGIGTARHVLAQTGLATHGDTRLAAEAVLALIRGRDPQDPVQQALRTAVVAARTAPGPEVRRIHPDSDVLRAHLARFGRLRHLALTSPSDPVVQARLDDAAYTLCVLVGSRTPHAALRAAREFLAERREGSQPA